MARHSGLSVATILQFISIVLLALLTGSIFGIWRGYDPTGYSQSAFLEVHQEAVRGLNVLLPAMALATLVCVAVLAAMSRARPPILILYGLVIVLLIAGGITTRFFNQTINSEVMTWTLQSMPGNWQEIRASWWSWHLVRLAIAFAAFVLLIITVFRDRGA